MDSPGYPTISLHVKQQLHIRVMREACSPKSLKIERATPHTRDASRVFVLGSRIHRSGSGQQASREPTMTSFYLFSRVG